MALSARHRWCINKINKCFEDQGVDDVTVKAFIRKPKNLGYFNALFSGNGQSALFVHYQSLSNGSDVSNNRSHRTKYPVQFIYQYRYWYKDFVFYENSNNFFF